MSWNNRKETYAFEKKMKELHDYYLGAGMTDEQIAEMEEYEKQEFNSRRNRAEVGVEVPLFVVGEDGFEHEYAPIAMSYEEDFLSDPFEYGFNDQRLNTIYKNADKTDRKILRLFADGLSQPQIAQRLGITQQAISKRLVKMSKIKK